MNTSNDRNLSKDSSIYSFRLLQRIRHRVVWAYLYWALTLGGCIAALFWVPPLVFAAAWILLPLLHAMFLRLLLKTKERQVPKVWTWSSRVPWVGYMPSNYIALSKARRLHTRMFFIILVLIACFYPWLPAPVFLFILAVHTWLLFPRFLVFIIFYKHASSGYLKINETDTSCYAQ